MIGLWHICSINERLHVCHKTPDLTGLQAAPALTDVFNLHVHKLLDLVLERVVGLHRRRHVAIEVGVQQMQRYLMLHGRMRKDNDVINGTLVAYNRQVTQN